MDEYEVDADGFVCVVAPDGYSGFVDEDWTLPDLLTKFAEQMNAGSLFVAYPGDEAADAALTVDAEEAENVIRRAYGVVRVGDGGLWLTDYTQLTMAAQFADEGPLASYAHRLDVDPGTYLVALAETGDGEYALTIRPHHGEAIVHDAVPWFTN
ncbi:MULTISPECIES: hypothetical protein [Microbacterium]|uniref:hypothetical protein n=1 Tax=Microbacterium TaxID=33882 RepID=UPI001E45D010|nr:hypothetical protein [Microbacterium nymphoidis]MCD2497124.1 hypothetical protein [Microbacterium nymphoidis]